MSAAYERVLAALGAGGWKVRADGPERVRAQCPAHRGTDLNLAVAAGDQGVLLSCHSHGCSAAEIADALGLQLADLFDRDGRATYDYGAGHIVTRTRTASGKSIRQRGAPAVTALWTPEGSAAIADSSLVVIGEGEKVADALARMGARCAATWPGGSGGIGKVDLSPLAGRDVIVCPDNDAPGEKVLERLTERLQGVARSVKVWRTPAAFGDVDGLNDAADLYLAGGSLDDLIAEPLEARPAAAPDRWTSGGAFIFDTSEADAALWGDGERVLWAEGESIMIYSAPGVGKTTLAGLLVRGRLGLDARVLGMPIEPGVGAVLWLAMDRPRQIGRALRRQFSPDERPVLDERLKVWRGPLLDDLARTPTLLADLAREVGATTLVIDSIKDAASRLAEDEGGRVYNIARQHALAAGVEVLELHHARKATGEGRRGLTLDDVYGSTWLVAGAGSVVALIGDPADDVLELRTMRAPRGDVALQVRVDREAGTMTAAQAPDALEALRGQGSMLARDVAHAMHGREPNRAEISRARRDLERLAEAGLVERLPINSAKGGPERIAYRVAEGALA